jgi:hypothetical protein
MVKDRVVASADAQSPPPTPRGGGTGDGWSFRMPDDRGGEQ